MRSPLVGLAPGIAMIVPFMHDIFKLGSENALRAGLNTNRSNAGREPRNAGKIRHLSMRSVKSYQSSIFWYCLESHSFAAYTLDYVVALLRLVTCICERP